MAKYSKMFRNAGMNSRSSYGKFAKFYTCKAKKQETRKGKK